MSAACIVKVVVSDPCKVTIIDPLKEDIRLIKVLEGPPGADGAPGPAGADGAPGPNRAIKSGVVLNTSFSGSPRKASVIFSAPYPDSTYSIVITGQDARSWTYESKTANGFTINSNASIALTGEVSWYTTVSGET